MFPSVLVIFGPRYRIGENFMSGLDGLKLGDKLFLLPSISVGMIQNRCEEAQSVFEDTVTCTVLRSQATLCRAVIKAYQAF